MSLEDALQNVKLTYFVSEQAELPTVRRSLPATPGRA